MCCWPPIAAACWPAAMRGRRFAASNEGFSERKVDALLVDHADPGAAVCGRGERQELWRRVCHHRWRQRLGADRPGPRGPRCVCPGAGAGWNDCWPGPITAFSLWSGATWRAGVAPHWEPRNTIANTMMKAGHARRMSGKAASHVEKKVKAPVIELDEPRACARPERGCLAGLDCDWAADQQGPGRQLAGRPR